MAQAQRQQDAAENVAVNPVRIESEAHAAKLRVPVGEVVSWARAFPRDYEAIFGGIEHAGLAEAA